MPASPNTAPEASALQWLGPSQTAGGQQPFLYSQCQPIHARSLAPLQDTARIRVRAGARFTVPEHLRALMAAASLGREPAGTGEAVDVFEMPQPIPPYLLAFAVGDLASRPLSHRTAVWAERSVAEAAAWEFEPVEAMLREAERLFGPAFHEAFRKDQHTTAPIKHYDGFLQLGSFPPEGAGRNTNGA